jgi:hypothetical protein
MDSVVLYHDVQLTGRVLKIDFTRNRFRQINTLDTPSPLRRDFIHALPMCPAEIK